MKILTLVVLSTLLFSCVQSKFDLAESSPLPHYFQIPDTTERADFTVVFTLYEDKANLTMFEFGTNKKLAEISGLSTTHSLSKKNKEKFGHPIFTEFNFNGKKEFLRHNEESKLFYVVRQQDIMKYYDSISDVKVIPGIND